MKKMLQPALLLLLISATLLQGCLKDQVERTYTYTYYKPIFKTTAEVRANIRSNNPQEVERPGKIYVYGSYLFLNEIDKGIHIIDNANPQQPRNVAFIDIPGNMDMAVKGNILYADLYTDLVAIDISNPLQAAVTKVVEDVFPHRYYGTYYADSTKIIATWIKRDTTITEKYQTGSFVRFQDSGVMMFTSANGAKNSAAAASPYGVGGSMARFTLASQRLYTVGSNDLNVFNVTTPSNPLFVTNKHIGWSIETIYPFKDKLFIGSTSGMFIYNITNPDAPSQTSQFNHVRSCDPVIADDTHAYVTLRSGTACQGFTNQLEVLDISNVSNPVLKRTYQLTNPHGLSKDGNLLFICDGRDGVKIYNAANPYNIILENTIAGIDTYDVITLFKRAIVVAKDGLYQYDYSDVRNIRLLSKIDLKK